MWIQFPGEFADNSVYLVDIQFTPRCSGGSRICKREVPKDKGAQNFAATPTSDLNPAHIRPLGFPSHSAVRSQSERVQEQFSFCEAFMNLTANTRRYCVLTMFMIVCFE